MKEVKNPGRREAVISFLISASSIADSLITLHPEYGPQLMSLSGVYNVIETTIGQSLYRILLIS